MNTTNSLIFAGACTLAVQCPALAQNFVALGSVTDVNTGVMEESVILKVDVPEQPFSVRASVVYEAEDVQGDVAITFDHESGIFVGGGVSAIPDENPKGIGVIGYEFFSGSNVTGVSYTTEDDFTVYTGFSF